MAKAIAILIVISLAGVCLADGPTTGPAITTTTAPTTPPTTDPAADSPQQAEVRAWLIKIDVDCFGWSLAQTRAHRYTTTDAEADWSDFISHEIWLQNQLEKAVREKWAADGDVKFIAATGGTTLEQDKVTSITVDGDHATTGNPNDGQDPFLLIKVKGQWMFDDHATFAAGVAKDLKFGRVRQYMGPVFKSMSEDLKAGKYDELDTFLADLKSKSDSVQPVDLDQ